MLFTKRVQTLVSPLQASDVYLIDVTKVASREFFRLKKELPEAKFIMVSDVKAVKPEFEEPIDRLAGSISENE